MGIQNRLSLWTVKVFLCILFAVSFAFNIYISVSAAADNAPAVDFVSEPEDDSRQNDIIISNDIFKGASFYLSNTELKTLSQNNTLTFTSPSITVLTHGLGATSAVWSNDGLAFCYKEDSLIEKLRKQNDDCLVFYAEITADDDLKLFKLDEGNYLLGGNYIENISYDDLQKHLIVVFEGREGLYTNGKGVQVPYNQQSLTGAYADLDILIDKLIYELKESGRVNLPRINLIGHSTGGLINIMYATEHPFNVASVFSIGTPYWGSNLGSVNNFKTIFYNNLLNSDGGKDLQDKESQQQLRDAWSRAININPTINAYALGGAINLEALNNLLDTNYIDRLSSGGEYSTEILTASLKGALAIITGLPLSTDFSVLVMSEALSIMTELNADKVFNLQLEEVNKILKEIDIRGATIFNTFNLSEDIFSVFNMENYRELLFLDDLFAGLDSQLAENYAGFKRFPKLYQRDDIDFNSVIPAATLPTLNDYEPQDPELIDYILDRIVLGAYSKILRTLPKSAPKSLK
jgi:alpha/beta hydrolase fold.